MNLIKKFAGFIGAFCVSSFVITMLIVFGIVAYPFIVIYYSFYIYPEVMKDFGWIGVCDK